MIKNILTLGVIMMSAVFVSQVTSSSASAATPPTATDSYNYVAQDGDNYSLVARKAVQTYGANTSTKLSLAQILFAENGLTSEAGSPELNLGQSVAVKKATVKAWIDKALKLSAADKAAWATYIPFVNFNTNAVGQKS